MRVRTQYFRPFNNKDKLKWYSNKLRICASKGSLKEGKAIHGYAIKDEVVPDYHMWVSLINMYAKSGSPLYARKVLDEIPEPEVVSWTAVMAGFVAEGRGSEGIRLFHEMKQENIRPNEFALTIGFKACSLCLNLEFGKLLHAEVIKTGFIDDVFVGSALVELYAKCFEMGMASRVFYSMPKKNDVSWNLLLNGYAEMGDVEELFNVFSQITDSKIKFSAFTLSTALKGCTTLGNLREGLVLHSLLIKAGVKLDQFIGCSLLNMYSKCGLANEALLVFKMIRDYDVVSWSAMITCLVQEGRSKEAAEILHTMRTTGTRPNNLMFAGLLNAVADVCDHSNGTILHACALKCGIESDHSVFSALITMYTKNGCLEDGKQLFKVKDVLNVASWNSLLAAYGDCKHFDEKPRIFYRMLASGIKPDMETFVSVLGYSSGFSDAAFGTQVHTHIVKNNLPAHYSIGTALIGMYMTDSRFFKDADVIFSKLRNRDIVAWTAMITGYAQSDRVEKALGLFNQMQHAGVKPNEFTLASCLSGCSNMAMLVNGRQLHCRAIKAGNLRDAFVGTSLLDMYGKCGGVDDANNIFQGLVLRDVTSYNSLINIYSKHGQGEESMKTFKMMLVEGILPDKLTFLGVLSGCSLIGLTEEGKRQFISMEKVYGINPVVEHYACMVNILGRAGKFDEVENFIRERKLDSYAIIWETVLGACNLHGNVELGERAAKQLFKLDPAVDVNYILLSNIYAKQNKWEDVKYIRELMCSRGVKKEVGYTWVEVNGQVHVFIAQDESHPKMRQIRMKLQELELALSLAGCRPYRQQVLHDGEKRETVHEHSGKLALAFALISFSPKEKIQIFQNLRICGDFHDFVKLISDITNRDIVVRDRKRFHHFNYGTCSCKDYW